MIHHLVFDGVADGPLGVALDVVATAARLVASRRVAMPARARLVRQRVLSIDGEPVRTGAGRRLEVDGASTPRSLARGDVLVLPGLGAATEPQIAALLARPDIRKGAELVARAAAKGVVVAASCSSTFVLAASGALDGEEATTTWWLREAFAKRFPRVKLRSERMVIESGGVFTAGAALAHADLMLAILSRKVSPSLAHTVARYLLLDERVSQARYMVLDHVRSSDPVIRKLEGFISANVERQLSLDDMATATATSPRTLARRLHDSLGTTPQRFAQRLRAARAAHLLETTSESVERVAELVGYADAAAFRRIFRRETGGSPRESRVRSSS